MKKRSFLLAILLLSVIPVMAQQHTGVLRVRFEDHSPLTLAVNGRHFQKTGSALTVGDLPRGRNGIKVYAFRAYRDGGGHAKLVFARTIRMKPFTVYYCIVNRQTGMARIYSRPLEEQDSYSDPEFDAGSTSAETVEAPAPRQDNKPVLPVDAKVINALEKEVSGHIADDDKLQLIQSELSDKYLSVAQIKEMMTWLGSETARLALARWAYGHAADPQQYDGLMSSFTYESSREELRDYIRTR